MTDINPPDLDELRAAIARHHNNRSENKLRNAVKLLTGFTDDQLDDLGGFGPDTTTH
jgi:hypothetical protein